MRRLLLVLLAVNVLLAVWFVLRPVQDREAVEVGERLMLVGESRELLVRPDASCLFVGPVQEERLLRDLRNLHPGWQDVVRSVPEQVRYRVYVAEDAFPTEQGADGGVSAVRRALQQAGLEDVESYQMVGGEFHGAVSFGLFAGLDNARRLLERLQESGIAAAMIEEPLFEEQRWLVELASNVPARALLAMENLLLTRPEMNIEQNLCEMFALRE